MSEVLRVDAEKLQAAVAAIMEKEGVAPQDAAIVADLGVFRLAQRYAPRLKLHVSTQAGVSNHEAARAWHELGASRVILARELAKRIESELEYPGQIKVHVLRETKAVDYAK